MDSRNATKAGRFLLVCLLLLPARGPREATPDEAAKHREAPERPSGKVAEATEVPASKAIRVGDDWQAARAVLEQTGARLSPPSLLLAAGLTEDHLRESHLDRPSLLPGFEQWTTQNGRVVVLRGDRPNWMGEQERVTAIEVGNLKEAGGITFVPEPLESLKQLTFTSGKDGH